MHKRIILSKHHRKPKSQGGSNDPENTAFVPVKRHQRFHALWDGSWTVEQIVAELNEVWLDPSIKLEIKKRK